MAAHDSGVQHAYHEDIDYYEGRAYGLYASARDGTEAAVEAFARRQVPITAAAARVVVAREHGFASWAALRRHVATLRDGDPFARAFRAIESHDVDGLRAQLERFPSLATAVGTNGNDLVGMAAATCDERLVAVLIEHGADLTHGNVHGWTALHQAAYSGLPPLARMLLDAGAPVGVSARGEGGTPLVIALFWGHRETAELLAQHGLLPTNLRAAAGLGRTDLIEALVAPDGRLAPEAGSQRAYYRPHSGFPDWQPSDDPGEIRDEALAWAARNDRVAALELLAGRGAVIDADVYRGTALGWAAACNRLDAITCLLRLGADPDRRASFGGPDHGRAATALHLAAGAGQLEAVKLLLAAGADPTIVDARHEHTPHGWAVHGGHDAVAELLRERGGLNAPP